MSGQGGGGGGGGVNKLTKYKFLTKSVEVVNRLLEYENVQTINHRIVFLSQKCCLHHLKPTTSPRCLFRLSYRYVIKVQVPICFRPYVSSFIPPITLARVSPSFNHFRRSQSSHVVIIHVICCNNLDLYQMDG